MCVKIMTVVWVISHMLYVKIMTLGWVIFSFLSVKMSTVGCVKSHVWLSKK